jgi:phage baseplate assembly protein W
MRKQYFDIKYPFTDGGTQRYVFDVNETQKERVASEILHVIFTPKGQRLRSPLFGTDLIKYIFEPNDSMTWSSIMNEIKETVSRWVRGVTINKIDVMCTKDGLEVYVKIDYSVKDGNSVYDNKIVIQL